MKKLQVNVYLAPEINDFLAKTALKNNTSKSEIAENLIKDFKDKNESIKDLRSKALKEDAEDIKEHLQAIENIFKKHLED